MKLTWVANVVPLPGCPRTPSKQNSNSKTNKVIQ